MKKIIILLVLAISLTGIAVAKETYAENAFSFEKADSKIFHKPGVKPEQQQYFWFCKYF